MSHHRPKDEDGSALLGALLLALVLMGLGASLVSTGFYRSAASRAQIDSLRCLALAESGLDLAMYELQSAVDIEEDGLGNVRTVLRQGTCEVSIEPELGPEGTYTLRATARIGRQTRDLERVVLYDPGFPHGMFSDEEIDFTGHGLVDSYRSKDGSYDSQVGAEGFALSNAQVRSNGDIEGMATIHGDATPGPSGSVSGVTVTGSTAPSDEEYELEPYVYDPSIPSTGVSWNGGGALPPGVHRFDKLKIAGGGTLTLHGKTVLYVDDDLVLTGGSMIVLTGDCQAEIHHGGGKFSITGGGILNVSGQPDKLSISSEANKIEYNGGIALFGSVYAPDADLKITGGSSLYGGFATKKCEVTGGGSLHYDESLGGVNEDGLVTLMTRSVQ